MHDFLPKQKAATRPFHAFALKNRAAISFSFAQKKSIKETKVCTEKSGHYPSN
jgi:hypothetical protein